MLPKDGWWDIITLKGCSCNWFSSRGGSGESNDKDGCGNGNLHFDGGLLGFGFKKDGLFCIEDTLGAWLMPFLEGRSPRFYIFPSHLTDITVAQCLSGHGTQERKRRNIATRLRLQDGLG